MITGRKNRAQSDIVQAVRLFAQLLGDKAEVLVCERSGEARFRVAHVENPGSGRKPGDALPEPTPLDLAAPTGIFNNIKTMDDGRLVRVAAVPLLDAKGEVAGAVVVHFDISELAFVQGWLQNLSGIQSGGRSGQCEDVGELMDLVIDQASRAIGKPAAFMNRVDKKKFIKYLDERGVFQIKKSSEKVARFLDISKFTLYACLEEVRAGI